MTALRREGLVLLTLDAETSKRGTSTRPERQDALHGRRRQSGQHRGGTLPCVRLSALVVAVPASELPLDARLHGGQHLRNVQGRQARGGIKVQSAGTILREDAVQHERVNMDVQIEGSPEPLDHGHCAPATVRDASVAPAGAQQAEYRTKEHRDDGAARVVIPRELVAQAVRQTQHPLSHGHVGEHVIDEVGGALVHPAAAAARTERALARKGDEPVEAAIVAVKPREPAREPATLQEVPELLFHEAGQAFPLAQAGGLRAKGLEVIVHNSVERTLRGTPRFVIRRGCGHAKPKGGRRASENAGEIGLNARARTR